jgi:uncharacterized GH25 family protein
VIGRWAFALALAAGPAAAHDFWIQPQAFRVAPGAEVGISLQVGDGPDRQRSAIPLRRVLRFEAIGPDGAARDLKGALADGRARFGAPGTYVLALATDAGGRSRQAAAKFNAYLADEGLTPAIEARAKAGRADREGSERYARAAKAIVQAGAGDAAAATRPVGLPLEIVPLADPFARPDRLPVRVLLEGRPLPGALVKLTDLAHDTETAEAHRTDAAGQAAFVMPAAGDWRLSVVWTKPLGPDEDADFETTFSSLSFGFSGP